MDDRVKQQLIGETVAKTMKQLMEEGRLLMDKETSTHKKEKFNKGPSRSRGKKTDQVV